MSERDGWIRGPVAWFVVMLLVGLQSTRVARAQADVEVELQHIKRLHEAGRWLEVVDEADRSLQGLWKQIGGKMTPAANPYVTFAALKAKFAAASGNLKAAEDSIKSSDRVTTAKGFQQMVAATGPADKPGSDADNRALNEYNALMLVRTLWLIDARTEVAIARRDWEAAEKQVQAGFQARRAGGGRAMLLATRSGEGGLLSPNMLAAVSTFEPSRLAAEMYLERGQVSRARSYLLDAEHEVAGALADAFPPGDDRHPRVPEWPTDGTAPQSEQREAMTLRAKAAALRGRVEAAEGNSEKAEAAFDEALELWRLAFETDHPESLPALLGTARLAIARAEDAASRRDAKTASARAAKARRVLAVVERIAEPALWAEGPRATEVKELTARVAKLDVSAVDTSALETAEKAAREALRSLSKYKTPGAAPVVRPDAADAAAGKP